MTIHDKPSSEESCPAAGGISSAAPDTRAGRCTGLLAIIVFLIVSVWGFSYALWQRGHDTDPFAEEADIALHLYRGHGFASPMDASAAAPPTAFSPPVYPCVIAGVYRLFGPDTMPTRLVLLAINALCLGASAAGLVVLGGRLFSPWVGACAGLLLGFHPSIVFFVLNYWDMHLAMALFIWLMVLAQGGESEAGGTSPARALLLGAGMAVLSLTNASYVLGFPFLAWVAVRHSAWRCRIGRATVLGTAFVLVMAPWTVRNYRAFHKVFFVRAGADLELWLGNMPGSHGLTNEQARYHPYLDPREKKLLLDQGELAYYRTCRERFWKEAREHPGAIVRRSVRRAAYLLVGDPHEGQLYPLMPNWRWRGLAVWHMGFYGVTLALAAVGVALVGRGRRWPLGAALLAIAPFAMTHVFDRYSMPLRAGLMLYVAALPWLAWRAAASRARAGPAERVTP